jgi:hypothetical protein
MPFHFWASPESIHGGTADVKSPKPGVCRGVAPLIVAGLVFLSGGCAADQQQLTLRSSRQNQTFTQQFSRAYAVRDAGGDTEIVLVDQAAQKAIEGNPSDSPVRQVLHIRVLWHPSREMKADHTSATNSTMHWYVMGCKSAGDVLEYAGTAFVSVEPDEGITNLTISNASLKPVACRGELCDPVGPATIAGKVRATNSGPRVRQALSLVQTAIAAANSLPNTASAHNPPERPSSAAQ